MYSSFINNWFRNNIIDIPKKKKTYDSVLIVLYNAFYFAGVYSTIITSCYHGLLHDGYKKEQISTSFKQAPPSPL